MKEIISIVTIFAIIVGISDGAETVDLGGRWQLKEATGKYSDLNGEVPGGIYTDLMNNNVIGDVLYGYNDTETRWVAKTKWIYYKEFIVGQSFLSHENLNIVFEGLDTFAAILVNNVEIGRSQNMFVRYIFDCKNVLQVGKNSIEVRFESPTAISNQLFLNQTYVVPPNCPPPQYRGECHVNQIRKMQASFSWDWGPAFPSVGIWKRVTLEAFNSTVIRYLMTETIEAPDSWTLKVTTYLSPSKSRAITGELLYKLQVDTSEIEEIVNVDQTSHRAEIKLNYYLPIPKASVRRWWPNGYGEQRLYNLTVTFVDGGEKSSKTSRIGFRTVKLVQEKIGSGLSFYFKVNGVPIFAKGANEIPLDILPEKGQNPQTVRNILKSAQEANMNMLRVWGGGVYESDYFYDLADELGILIWQDFMFACAMYPTNPEYLSNVVEEVRHQVKRLNGHPSIAVWAANNENEVALVTDWFGTSKNFSLYKADFIKLYVDTVRTELREITNVTVFLTSSPTNGKESEAKGYLAPDPQNPLFGDVHFYNYLLNSLNVNTYPIPRFASEYGYQSLPDLDAWLTATDNISNLVPWSKFMDHRQHHPGGYLQNLLLIKYQLLLPENSSVNYYKAYIFYSQIVQALSIKFETEYYRSFMGRLNKDLKGNTMGALFWQLNDVWVAPTWSGIDYTGKWKMLHYYAKNFFSPTIITGYLNTERQLEVYVVSEVASLVGSSIDVTASIDVYKWDSFAPLNTTDVKVGLEFGKSVAAAVLDTDPFLSKVGCGSLSTARNSCFFVLSLRCEDVLIAPENLVLATSLKDSNVPVANLKVSTVEQKDDVGKIFEITLETDAITLFVWLDSHRIRGRFSENGFAQLTATRTVQFASDAATDVEELRKILTVTHLKDSAYG